MKTRQSYKNYPEKNKSLKCVWKRIYWIIFRWQWITQMSALEKNKEGRLKPEETIAERIKLNPQKWKARGVVLKILTPD